MTKREVIEILEDIKDFSGGTDSEMEEYILSIIESL